MSKSNPTYPNLDAQPSGERTQTPYPQHSRQRPSHDDEIIGLAKKSKSDSPVAGLNGWAHPNSESQYFHNIAGGLQTRKEGTRQHEFSSNPDVESLHDKTVAEVARSKYRGDEVESTSHHAIGARVTKVVGSQTRLGQGKQSDNRTPEA